MIWSPLVSYTAISPNKNPREGRVCIITPHCTAGGSSLQGIATEFDGKHGQKSANYCIDRNGKIGGYVPEDYRSWASSSRQNDHQAITIELMSDAKPPYRISEATAKALVGLCVDICKRHGIPKLLWFNNRSLIGHPDEQNITLHRWFTATDCPGEYIISILPNVVEEVNKRLSADVSRETYSVCVDFPSEQAAKDYCSTLKNISGHSGYVVKKNS